MSDNAKKKFAELMAALSGKSTAEVIDAEVDDGDMEDVLSSLGAIKVATVGGEKPTPSQVAAADPNFLKAILMENAAIATLQNPTPWLVQVYPDTNNVLHFQAKTTGSTKYLRYYFVVPEETWSAVKAAYDATPAYRQSMAASEKMYLICEFESLGVVKIPSYGTVKVPQLFGQNGESDLTPQPETAAF